MSNSASAALTLEQLRLTYTNTLNTYERLIAEYKTITATRTLDVFDVSQNLQLVGGTRLNTLTGKTIGECKTACATTTACAGANFRYTSATTNTSSTTSTSTGICELYSGNMTLEPNTNYYAIVLKSKLLLYEIQTINASLLRLNRQIVQRMDALKVDVTDVYEENDTSTFQSSYQQLLSEREKLDALVNEYHTFESTYHDGVTRTTQSYYTYILYSILVVICILLIIYPITVSTASHPTTLQFFQNMNYYIEENIVVIAILCISVPLCYYLMNI
jgi:hypothetical protein